MKKIFTTILAGIVAAGAIAADHKELYVVGEATLTGWNLGTCTSLPQLPNQDNVYQGTMYLKNTGDFKFLTGTNWGGLEYGAEVGATIVDGKLKLASGQEDSGYGKVSVAESANYLITVNTETLEATIVKSVYQEREINFASLYIIGSVYEPAYGFNEAPVMFQITDTPYILQYKGELANGKFKICYDMGNGRNWWQNAFYYCNPDDSSKMIYDDAADNQWTIPESGNYIVTSNVFDNTISIEKTPIETGVEDTLVASEAAEYYNLQGIRVANPREGIYLVRTAAGVKKVIIR